MCNYIPVLIHPHELERASFEYKTLRILQSKKCFYCERELRHGNTSVDHFIPKSYGYTKIGNVVLCCKKCNRRKADKIPSMEQILRFIALYEMLNVKHPIVVRNGKPVFRIELENNGY